MKKKIKEIEKEIVSIRRDIHAHPELGFEEVRTAALVADYLENLGLKVEKNIAKTGVLGILKGTDKGPVIAFRADMDALPVDEKNESPYMSKEIGKMHACGHDAHVAILLAVAAVLAEIKEEIQGQIKFIFQPAEEGPGGARPMIEEGVLEDPAVDVILGLHVWSDLEAGSIGIKKGPLFASIDEVDFIIKGESSHGASPHQGVDAIVIAANIINALQTVISRNISPLSPGVITIGRIEGGYRRNIIAEEVSLEATVRCLTPENRKFIEEKIRKISTGICDSLGGSLEIDYRNDYSPLVNNDAVTEIVENKAQEIVGIEKTISLTEPTMGGEDFAFFLERIPGCFFLLGASNKEKGITAPQHSPYFDIDEDILSTGIEVLVLSGLELLGVDL
ncbi:MAG: amidohydrolase [Firmicutes bacterium]|nr:amidohydrolase [Bacillota bacterium]